MARRRIVAAESEVAALDKLKEMLFRSGFSIVGEATDGMSVIKQVRITQPDLVVVDSHLPGMGGVAVAKILEEEALAPSLILTARAARAIIDQTRDSFFISLLVKPIRQQQLYTAIEQAIANCERFKKLDLQLEELKRTLANKKVIERAKAILMQNKALSEDEAHKMLQQMSMTMRKSISEIAMAVITANELAKD
ncbi:ANTAR domain-containing protein [Peptococcaceae bacterium 1198_IL3148]